MRLRHIEVFHAVKQTGSISKAAQLLGISQPAASKVLHHAEISLGFKLFQRIKGRLRATPEAELLFIEADRIKRGMDQIRMLAANLRCQPQGRLRIGCLPSLALSLTPRAVHAFRHIHPAVACQVETNHLDGLLDALRTRRLDLALAFAPQQYVGIQTRLLGELDLAYLGPDPGPGDIGLDEIDPDALIRIVDTDVVGRLVADSGALARPAQAPAAIESETYYAACAMAAEFGAVAIVDELTAHRMARPGQHVRRVRPRMTVAVGVLTHENEVMRSYYADFVRVLDVAFAACVDEVRRALAGGADSCGVPGQG